MNQEQVIGKLLELNGEVEDFSVTFTGKKSTKVDGLYKPENREIILHNKNFIDDNALIYTAIHEFAHHIQFTKSSVPISARAHTIQFWDIFHKLLFTAEEKKIFINIFKKETRFVELTKKLREQFLSVNGHLMKDFGKLLLEAYELCRECGVSFDDYVDRELQIHRSAAKTLIKLNSFDINPEIGYENMKIVASIRDPEERGLAEEAFAAGKSPDMVKTMFNCSPKNDPDNSLDYLVQKKDRIVKNIERLQAELENVEKQIEGLHN
jgi:hypothetical protein